MENLRQLAGAVVIGGMVMLSGCASHPQYQKAFAAESAIKGSSQSFDAAPDAAFKAAKLTLVKQGFTIDHADISGGVIKASRNLSEKSDEDVSYNIITTADITGDPANTSSQVTLAASQQTILHRKWHTWWHLLFIIPLFPTGTEYQTVVTHEGNVTDPVFYKDFFTALKANLPPAPVVSKLPAAAPLTQTPLPAATPVALPAQEATPAKENKAEATQAPAAETAASAAPAPVTPSAPPVATPATPAPAP